MKISNCFRYSSFLVTLLLSISVSGQQRELTTLQTNWKFSKSNPNNAQNKDFDDSNWETLQIPHDWAIGEGFIKDGNGDTGKLPWKGEGWYRRNLNISSINKGKKIFLIFDGVMAFPEVYINGKLAGKWDYGYNSFHLDITDFVDFESANVLAVYATTENHDSRWYPGGGIYRKVQLLTTNPIHTDIWGTYITTPIIKTNYAEVRVSTTVTNSTNKKAPLRVEQIVYDSNGIEITRGELKKDLKANNSSDYEVSLIVQNPRRWDIDTPEMYTTQTNIYSEGQLLDSHKTTFGIRTIKFTPDDGFHLNGRRVQLKGVNLHSDHGPLGVAFNTSAMRRQLEIMKSMGVNAIRNSHNVAAPELLDLCDEMGLLFFNEIFDKYDAKADILEDTDFEDFAHRNIKNFVLRDRNHPSVFLWSVGNEIADVQWNLDNGFKRLHTMVNYVNKYDPTRPTTLVCDNLNSAELRHFDYYDVHSWNYGRRYRLARQIEPNKSVIISESASTLSTRGFYEFPLPLEKTDFTKSLQVSSYDLNAPEWAEISDDDFMWQQDEPYVAGEFVWTGFDYLGEPTPYNNNYVKELGMDDSAASRSSYFGIVDLVGIPKDRYYLYKSYWKPEDKTIHVLPHWNWSDKIGENVPVFAYTNADCAELFVNDTSQGKKCKTPNSKQSIERFRLMWNDVIYQPGEVKVIAYINDKPIGEKILKTTGKPRSLKLSPERKIISADGEDLAYILIEAIDKDGFTCPLADNLISISVNGNAELAAVGNGNPQNFDSFKSNKVKLFFGKAMIILKSKFMSGNAKIEVNSPDLKSDSVTIRVE